MNIYITYRKQYGLAKTKEEAIDTIENFTNQELDEYLTCNDNITKWIELICQGKFRKQISVWTTNCGHNKKVSLRPTEHNDIKPILEEIEKENYINKVNQMHEVQTERKEYLNWLNTPRNGNYHVKLRFSYEGKDGIIDGDEIEDTIPAYSGYNAYMKMVDTAVEICKMRGHKFYKPKSLFSQSTEIDYIGE